MGFDQKPLSIQDKLIIALDVESKEEAFSLIERLEGQVKYVKVGMELFYAAGYSFIEDLKKKGLHIFLDVKMHDIPNTVGRAAAQLTRLEVDMFNLHAAGGLKMMEEAKNQMEKTLSPNQKQPLLISVTQLTSTDDRMLKEEIGIPATVAETVIRYAQLTKKAGLDGVVSSPLEVEGIKKACGKDFITVTPGIRLAGGAAHDQKRITTPEQAIQLGSDYLVIGRAVTQAEKPAEVFASIVESINKK